MDAIILIYAALNIIYTIFVNRQLNALMDQVIKLKLENEAKDALLNAIILKQNAEINAKIED